jgi:hypothetical protein
MKTQLLEGKILMKKESKTFGRENLMENESKTFGR